MSIFDGLFKLYDDAANELFDFATTSKPILPPFYIGDKNSSNSSKENKKDCDDDDS